MAWASKLGFESGPHLVSPGLVPPVNRPGLALGACAAAQPRPRLAEGRGQAAPGAI